MSRRRVPLPARAAATTLLCVLFQLPAQAQVTLEPDGRWRHLFTAGANISSGNNDAASLNLSIEGARLTAQDKWTWDARADRSRSQGADTVERYEARTQYNRDFSADWFGFGSGAWLRDRLANLSSRVSVASGVGRHLWRNDGGFFDVTAGLGYSLDRYVTPAVVAGRSRDAYGRAELVLAEESRHRLSDTTGLRQKFSYLRDLRESGRYRTVLDLGVTVAMTERLNLTAGLSHRYDSDPGGNLDNSDLLFVTGVSVRFD